MCKFASSYADDADVASTQPITSEVDVPDDTTSASADLGDTWGLCGSVETHDVHEATPADLPVVTDEFDYTPEPFDYGIDNQVNVGIEQDLVDRASKYLQATVGKSDTHRWALLQYDVELEGNGTTAARITGTRITGTIDDGAIIDTAKTLMQNKLIEEFEKLSAGLAERTDPTSMEIN